MNNWKGAIRNEWDMIWLRGKTKGLLAISIVLPFVLGWFLRTINLSFGLQPLDPNGIGLTTLTLHVSLFLPLVIFTHAADSLTFQPQAMKAFFLRPIHRYKLYSAKLAAMLSIVSLHLGLALVGSLLAGWIFQERAGWNAVLQGLASYGMSILPMLVWISIASLVAQCFKSPSGAMISLILLYLFAQAAPFAIPGASVFSPAHYNGWHTLALAGTSAVQPLLLGLTYMLSSISLYFGLGFIMFERRNL
jgi:ABC-2 type transport system permease protein